MEPSIIAIIATISLSLLTGITFIAYKHPKGYQKLYWPLVGLLFGEIIFRTIYNAGLSAGFYTAIDGVRVLNKEAYVKTPSLSYDSIWWLMIPLILFIYFLFLNFLPAILELDKSDLKSKDKCSE